MAPALAEPKPNHAISDIKGHVVHAFTEGYLMQLIGSKGDMQRLPITNQKHMLCICKLVWQTRPL